VRTASTGSHAPRPSSSSKIVRLSHAAVRATSAG
jgi:hypothetical protein